MSPYVFLLVLICYFGLLILISRQKSKGSSFGEFYTAGRKAPWYLVSFGMIGATLSGVTFISVPGWVGDRSFSYMQMQLGFMLGYAIIAFVLIPLYYKWNVDSIYEVLQEKLGMMGRRTGATFFLISRSIGASFRLFLVAMVMHEFVFSHWNIPFAATVAVTLALIWIYTYRSGIKTIIWTDAVQTASMLLVLVIVLVSLSSTLNINLLELPKTVLDSAYGQVFFFENGWSDSLNFFKQVLAGMFITIVMTGLDQDMMQKNLSCPSASESRKNMLSFSVLLVVINFFFLSLGALLFMYMDQVDMEIPTRMVNGELRPSADLIFPTIAIDHLGPAVGLLFFVGLMAAAYSSADSALTALTTSFCVDFLGLSSDSKEEEGSKKRKRNFVHFGFSVVLFILIISFHLINDQSVISSLFTVAGYTYGPLLGMFCFVVFTKARMLKTWVIPVIAVLSPILTYVIDANSEVWLGGYKFGFELVLLNGLICFTGLFLFSKKNIKEAAVPL